MLIFDLDSTNGVMGIKSTWYMKIGEFLRFQKQPEKTPHKFQQISTFFFRKPIFTKEQKVRGQNHTNKTYKV